MNVTTNTKPKQRVIEVPLTLTSSTARNFRSGTPDERDSPSTNRVRSNNGIIYSLRPDTSPTRLVGNGDEFLALDSLSSVATSSSSSSPSHSPNSSGSFINGGTTSSGEVVLKENRGNNKNLVCRRQEGTPEAGGKQVGIVVIKTSGLSSGDQSSTSSASSSISISSSSSSSAASSTCRYHRQANSCAEKIPRFVFTYTQFIYFYFNKSFWNEKKNIL